MSSVVEPIAGLGLDGLYEVVDGRVVEKPPIDAYGMSLANLVVDHIYEWQRGDRRGRGLVEMLFDFRPTLDRQRRPDVAFVSDAKWPLNRRAPKAEAWAVVPDLAVEIVGPASPGTEILAKVHEYFAVGVSQVWVVWPDQQQLYAYASPAKLKVFGRGDDLDGGDVLPGLRIDIAELFGPEVA